MAGAASKCPATSLREGPAEGISVESGGMHVTKRATCWPSALRPCCCLLPASAQPGLHQRHPALACVHLPHSACPPARPARHQPPPKRAQRDQPRARKPRKAPVHQQRVHQPLLDDRHQVLSQVLHHAAPLGAVHSAQQVGQVRGRALRVVQRAALKQRVLTAVELCAAGGVGRVRWVG